MWLKRSEVHELVPGFDSNYHTHTHTHKACCYIYTKYFKHPLLFNLHKF
jgi:hypothetical protein